MMVTVAVVFRSADWAVQSACWKVCLTVVGHEDAESFLLEPFFQSLSALFLLMVSCWGKYGSQLVKSDLFCGM